MDFSKVGPALVAAHGDFVERRQASVMRHARVLTLVTAQDTSPKPARAVVFLHASAETDFARLERDHNIQVNAGTGAVRTAIVPLDALDGLSEDPAVERILGTRRMQPSLDVAKPAVNVPAFVSATGLTGSGVIVGVVDTGIDPNHAAFAGRILQIWDQTAQGSGVPEGGYGAELTGATMTQSRDTEGHGTHVCGIAAGDDPHFGGLAPGADIVMVKTDFSDGHIADGLQYIARVARDRSRPCVINLSLGGHWDAHDGTDSLSRVVDTVSAAGCIVCIAAGNEGTDDIHARVTVAQGATETLACTVPVSPGATGPTFVVFNGWYSGSEEMRVAVASPGGFQTAFQDVINSGSPVVNYSLQEGEVQIATGPPDPGNGDHQFLVMIQPATGSQVVTGGTWRLSIEGVQVKQGRTDVWALDDLENSVARFVGSAVADDTKVGSPGAATNAITVASYTTKNAWTDIDNVPRHMAFPVNAISDFSSEGPRRDGVEKPDLAAPGAMIVSALSADSNADRGWMLDSAHRAMAGTSMATPFVAGVVALLLERTPALDPGAARSAFRGASTVPGQSAGSTFDTKWGYGLIDVSSL